MLDKLATQLAREVVDQDERRYLIDRIAEDSAARAEAEIAAWRAEAEQLDWDADALAERWELDRRATQRRLAKLRPTTPEGVGDDADQE